MTSKFGLMGGFWDLALFSKESSKTPWRQVSMSAPSWCSLKGRPVSRPGVPRWGSLRNAVSSFQPGQARPQVTEALGVGRSWKE